MKSIDVDAKHLIRKYIDSIEEYLREHTRLHPNEIDGLLNEINDFVYLRSNELASEERVCYNDVLKAIEECGSPSEICEQYLELDREKQPAPFSPKAAPPPSQPPVAKRKKSKFHLPRVKGEKSIYSESSAYRSGPKKKNPYYLQSLWFGLYRVLFILFLFSLIIQVISITYIDLQFRIDDGIFAYSLNVCGILTIWALLLVFLEGVVINRWKKKLVKKKQADRSFDDSLIVWISRISFLVLFFKAAISFIPGYVFYAPIWFILAMVFERQMKSRFWEEQFSPFLIHFGSLLSNPDDEQAKEKMLSYRTRITDQYSKEELRLTVFLGTILVLNLIIPLFLSVMPGRISNMEFYLVFSLSFVAMVGVLGILVHYKRKKPSAKDRTPFTGESEFIFIFIRLLALQSILALLTSLDMNLISSFAVLGIIIIILVLITSEIVSNSYGGKSFRLWFGKVLVKLGSSSSIQKLNETPSKSIPLQKTKENPQISFSSYTESSPSSISKEQALSVVAEPFSYSQEKKVIESPKSSSWILRVFNSIGYFGKALLMTIILLLISLFEVFLVFIVSIISFSSAKRGLYTLPVIDLKPYNGLIDVLISGYTVSIWHVLFILSIQVFIIVTFKWYILISKKPEGIILKVYQNLTRVLLMVIMFGSLLQIVSDKLYADILLLVVISLIFFSEITAWKVHSERKKLFPPTFEQEVVIPDNEEKRVNPIKITKPS